MASWLTGCMAQVSLSSCRHSAGREFLALMKPDDSSPCSIGSHLPPPPIYALCLAYTAITDSYRKNIRWRARNIKLIIIKYPKFFVSWTLSCLYRSSLALCFQTSLTYVLRLAWDTKFHNTIKKGELQFNKALRLVYGAREDKLL